MMIKNLSANKLYSLFFTTNQHKPTRTTVKISKYKFVRFAWFVVNYFRMSSKRCCAAVLFLLAATAFAQNIGITGSIEWDKADIQALVSLNLASANLTMPSGRTRAEALVNSAYLSLIRPVILGIRADSSSTLADLVQRGDLNLNAIDEIALAAPATPPFLSPDLLNIQAAYRISRAEISAALIRHSSPAEIRRTLMPVPSADYTGIIIIASSPLPVHGMKSSALLVPCLFPKIWDTDMNLLFERNMLERGRKTMVHYAPRASIFHDSPSGISPQAAALVGLRPLRIFARGLFGATPTDLIIDTQDTLRIIATEQNRRLLREGRVLIIVDDSALKITF